MKRPERNLSQLYDQSEGMNYLRPRFMELLVVELCKRGWTLYHRSESMTRRQRLAGSPKQCSYYLTPPFTGAGMRGRPRLRISNHRIPDSRERNGRRTGGADCEFIPNHKDLMRRRHMDFWVRCCILAITGRGPAYGQARQEDGRVRASLLSVKRRGDVRCPV